MMSIVVAVNGIIETYPIRPARPRQPRIDPLEAEGEDHQRPPTQDRSVLAAQTAYQQQTSQEDRQPKLALVASDLMTSSVLSLPSDHGLIEAWTTMTCKGFRHVPVTSVDGTLVGMVSDRDLLRHAPDLIVGPASSQTVHRQLAEVMTSRVVSASPTTDIREIARVILDEHIHAVPILERNRRIVGIITTRDLIRGIAQQVRSSSGPSPVTLPFFFLPSLSLNFSYSLEGKR